MKVLNNFPVSSLDFPTHDSWCINVYYVGCDFRCPDCQNRNLQSFDYTGDDILDLDVGELIQMLLYESSRNFNEKNICLLGGDPLALKNREFTNELLKINDYFNICVYTGYEFEYVKDIDNYDYLITGQYDLNQKQISEKTEKFFSLGSKNQKVFNKNKKCISKNGIIRY